MNIFLTGGSGFIGSNFLKMNNIENLYFFSLIRPESKSKIFPQDNIEWIHANYFDSLSVPLSKSDLFFHLASHSTNPPYDNLENCIKENILNFSYLFENAISSGIKKFLIAGSCFEYGLSANRYDFIPTDANLLPTNSYAISKAMLSNYLFFQSLNHPDIEINILRFFHIYGDGENVNRLYPSLVKAADNGLDYDMTLGEQIRDFLSVDQLVKLLRNFLNTKKNETNFNIYNIGSGIPVSIREFATNVWKSRNATGKINFGKIPYRENEIMRLVPNVDKIKRFI